MALKLLFMTLNALLLAGFLTSFAGFGGYALKLLHLRHDENQDKGLTICLSMAVGMGIYIVFLQILGVLGYFYNYNIALLTLMGLILFFLEPLKLALPKKWSDLITFAFIYLILMALTKGMALPTAFDEVMYHLPHARLWAESGSLSVNQSLRFPYFPYNFELLYAAALSLHQELLTHLLHAATGVLTIVGTYRLALLKYSRATALLAAFILYYSFLALFRTAYIDLALCFFISFSFYSLYLAYQENKTPYLYLSGFLLGVALGVKYLALIFIPPFGLLLLLKERRFTRLMKVMFCLLLPCAFWYVRNAWLVGNPLDPFASSIFGFHSWSALDFKIQVADLKSTQDWPSVLFWPALGVLFLLKRAQNITRVMAGIVFYTFVVWYFSSHYSRYLMPVYPMMAILSALTLTAVLEKPKLALNVNFAKPLKGALVILLMLGLSIPILENTSKIKVSHADKTDYLKSKILDFEVAVYLNKHPEYQVYQFNLEDTMYYLPATSKGDHFGVWRYRDFVDLDSKTLAKQLQQSAVNAIVVSDARQGQQIYLKKDFSRYFTLVLTTNTARLYRINQGQY